MNPKEREQTVNKLLEAAGDLNEALRDQWQRRYIAESHVQELEGENARLEKENAERKVDPVLGQPVEYWHNRWVDENVERIQLQRERDSLLAALKNANANSKDMIRDLRGVQDAHVDAERRVRWLEGQLKVRDHNIDHQKERIVELTKERDEALAEEARLAGERNDAQDKVSHLRADNDRLRDERDSADRLADHYEQLWMGRAVETTGDVGRFAQPKLRPDWREQMGKLRADPNPNI